MEDDVPVAEEVIFVDDAHCSVFVFFFLAFLVGSGCCCASA